MRLHRASHRLAAAAAVSALVLTVSACGDDDDSAGSTNITPTDSAGGSVSGSVAGSGSGSASGAFEDQATGAPLTPEEQTAVEGYRNYITAQVADSVTVTEELVEAVKADDITKAKTLYAKSRIGWESIEPVAAAFGDLDPRVDLREADVEDGDTWTGWHVLEKALWEDKDLEGMDEIGDTLLDDLDELTESVKTVEITPTAMAMGAKELLDEVASGKITGEEEAFSHTDLVDFKANLDGARKVFDLLKPIAERNDADLVKTLETEFDDVDMALEKYEKGDSYVSYDTVTESERKALTDVVNALGEPLSKLAGAIQSDSDNSASPSSTS
ncbi:iron uptake system protein EfeO [Sporichthya sp.]|uniref:iron uptake system protein EfeO n=1 Tax=Sporichthya sp. TaxID=65475 RepID=UPI00180E399C|nr:iron uptake system protein EfeO [Sporichthya sp.]MBA3744061.1 EfeM/EfeO family lipoprotein [Sporichthya sp.]